MDDNAQMRRPCRSIDLLNPTVNHVHSNKKTKTKRRTMKTQQSKMKTHFSLTKLCVPPRSLLKLLCCLALYGLGHLTVSAQPVITDQPVSLILTQGNTGAFTVTASGPAPLSYQWIFCPKPNWNQATNIQGATSSSLTIPTAQFSDAGTYLVIVSDSFGSVTSSPASLTVVSLPSLLYEGLVHSALGQASLSLQSNLLTVGNFGPNTQDGVIISGGDVVGMSAELDDLSFSDTNSILRTTMRGTLNGTPNLPVGAVQVERVGSNLVLTADYTPVGSTSYTVEVWSHGTMVARQTNVVGQLATIGQPMAGRKCELICVIIIIILVCIPLAAGIAVGPHVITLGAGLWTGVGDEIRVMPENPVSTVPSMHSMSLQGSSLASLTLTNEAVQMFGLEHHALGQAIFQAQSGQLTVTNLGTNGQDGVSVALPNNLTGWDAHWLNPEGAGALPVGAYLKQQVIGTGGSVTNGVLETVQITKAGTSNYVISADFSPVGAITRTVEVYNGPSLVARVTGQSGPACAISVGMSTSASVHAGCCPPYVYVDVDFDISVSLAVSGGPTVMGDRLVVIPEGGASVSFPTAVQITSSKIPSITFTSEEKALLYSGLMHTSIGNATLSVGSNMLAVSNLGTNGEDGVSVALGQARSFSMNWLGLDPLGTIPDGASLRISAKGRFGGVGDYELGSVQVDDVGSQLSIRPDYSPIGNTTQRLEVWNNGQLVSTVTNHTGTAAFVTSWPTGCGKRTLFPPFLLCYFLYWVQSTAITIPGGSTVVGNELRILAENGSGTVDYLSSFAVQAAAIPSISITDETVQSLGPLAITSIAKSGTALTLNWTGGTPPYSLQRKSSLTSSWSTIATGLSGPFTTTPITGSMGFYRISGP
jgi:hypothetical protein